jgi:GTPase SAR1 family protein
MERGDVRALLVTGTYGSGKTTLVEELAELLEERGDPYGAIDLDWLGWFDVPGLSDDELDAVANRNLAAVVRHYLDAGVRYLLLAGAVRSRAELDRIRDAVGVPLDVVRLHVSQDEIRRRLTPAITTGRAKDLRESPDVLADQDAGEIDALDFANGGDVRELAVGVVMRLGW